MTYAMPVLAKPSESAVRFCPLVVPCRNPATTRVAANEDAPRRTDEVRLMEPMLLVHQDRAETFRLVAGYFARAADCWRGRSRAKRPRATG